MCEVFDLWYFIPLFVVSPFAQVGKGTKMKADKICANVWGLTAHLALKNEIYSKTRVFRVSHTWDLAIWDPFLAWKFQNRCWKCPRSDQKIKKN